MMRRLFLLCSILSILVLGVAVQAQGGLDTTTNTYANLRSGPGTTFNRIIQVPTGTPFRVDGRIDQADGSWLRGITPNSNVGWIRSDLLTLGAAQVASLPVIDAASAFALSAPPAGSAQVAGNAAPVRGFSYGGHVGDWGTYASDQMTRAGMTWVKRQVRYSPGQDPGSIAGWINDAHARGFQILLGVVGDRGQLYGGGYFDQYASFVGGLAALGADGIEVWNEMNIDREWPSGSINPASYTDLLRVSYNAIKAANPNTLVISGAPAPTGFFGGCNPAGCDDNYYLAGMAAAGAANYMDCIGVHYNEGILPPTATSGDPRGSSSHYTRYFRSMMNTYYNAFGGARPLCFTELGYLTPEGFGPLPPGFEWASNTTVAQQASWLDQAVSLSAQSGRVRLLIIWNIDFGVYDSDPQAGYAIIRPGGGCPACDALGS